MQKTTSVSVVTISATLVNTKDQDTYTYRQTAFDQLN